MAHECEICMYILGDFNFIFLGKHPWVYFIECQNNLRPYIVESKNKMLKITVFPKRQKSKKTRKETSYLT